MYRHGFELPEFAMFPLLDIPSAVAALHDMFRAQLDVAAEFGFGFLLSGLDYRASPDWGAKLGYSATALADANIAAIAFLPEVADDYRAQIPSLLNGGLLGPRGAAHGLNREIAADSAGASNADQLDTLKRAKEEFSGGRTLTGDRRAR